VAKVKPSSVVAEARSAAVEATADEAADGATEPAAAEGLGTRGERRRSALLLAARDVFLECGYEGASIEEVMRRVGGSKASLYRYFGNKEGLFGDIIAAQCAEFMSGFRIPTRPDDDIERTLTEIARRFVGVFLERERRELFRIIVAEMPRFPALAKRFYENGPQRARRMLGDYFRLQHEAGTLHCPDPEFTATQFIEMAKANPHHRALLGLDPFLPGHDIDRHIAGVVDLFLHGCARRRSPAP